MSRFPFSEAEWSRVGDASLAAVNATLADDPVVRESCFEDLRDALSGLREQHGEHPVLLETEADFSDSPEEQIALYEKAKRLALAHGLPTVSICLSLARLLCELGRPDRAKEELISCQAELAAGADPAEAREWSELLVCSNPPPR